jgi:two-component system chemotaxis response regulator CheB
LADTAMRLQPGVVHVCPDWSGLVFVAREKIAPEKLDRSSNVHCSIDRLFESAAQHVGKGALAILLTGMGRDGAAGLGALARCGASTIAQSPETCTVDSMPRTAVERRAAQLVLRPEEIAALLRARLV